MVKSAIFGKDPNWGRVVAAAGYSGATEQERLFFRSPEERKRSSLGESGEISDF